MGKSPQIGETNFVTYPYSVEVEEAVMQTVEAMHTGLKNVSLPFAVTPRSVILTVISNRIKVRGPQWVDFGRSV